MKEECLIFEPVKRADHLGEGDESPMLKNEDLRWLDWRLDGSDWDILSSEVSIKLLGDDRPEMIAELKAAKVVCNENYARWRAGRTDFQDPVISETTLDAIRLALKAEQDRRLAPFRCAYEKSKADFNAMVKLMVAGKISEEEGDKIAVKEMEASRALDKAEREITWVGWDAILWE